MRTWMRAIAVAVLLAAAARGFAQPPSGPRTLESLLREDGESGTGQASRGESRDGRSREEQPAGRPRGILVRPKSGVPHPDLDRAWIAYKAAVAKASEAVRAAIARQFDAATAKGDLDAAEKWQAIGDTFDKEGGIPSEVETKAVANTAAVEFRKAREELGKAYEAVVKSLTMEKKIPEAKTVRDELRALQEASGGDDAEAEAPPAVARSGKNRREAGVFLAELPEQNPSVGWGSFGKNSDLGYEGLRIVVRGHQVTKGLSMCPPSNGRSEVTYAVPTGCTAFEAHAAMNDSSKVQNTPVVFRVIGDGRVLWSSPPIKGPGNGVDCSVPLKGAKSVTLTVDCPGPFGGAHAVWVDPRFVKK